MIGHIQCSLSIREVVTILTNFSGLIRIGLGAMERDRHARCNNTDMVALELLMGYNTISRAE